MDTTSSYFSYMDNIIYTESVYKKDTYFNKINNYNFVSQGILGKKGDVIVDDVKKPKKILGICAGDGTLKKFSFSEKKKLIKKIKQDTSLNLIYG